MKTALNLMLLPLTLIFACGGIAIVCLAACFDSDKIEAAFDKAAKKRLRSKGYHVVRTPPGTKLIAVK